MTMNLQRFTLNFAACIVASLLVHSACAAPVNDPLGVNKSTKEINELDVKVGASHTLTIKSGGTLISLTGSTVNLANGTVTLPASFSRIDVQQAGMHGADAGSTDSYAITLSPAITSYATGELVWWKANTANTGPASLNICGLGAKTIKKTIGGVTTDLATNDILAGQWVLTAYDGINFQMLSPVSNAPSGGGSLPSQTGNSGKFLTTDGTTASWGSPSAGAVDSDATLTGDRNWSLGGHTLTIGPYTITPTELSTGGEDFTSDGGDIDAGGGAVTAVGNGGVSFSGTGAADTRTHLGLVIGTNVQAYDADLTTYAGITPTTVAQNLLGLTNPSAISFIKIAADNSVSTRTPSQVVGDLGLTIGTNVEAWDADLDTWAGITPTTAIGTWLATPSGANLASALTSALTAPKGGTGQTSYSTGDLLYAGSSSTISKLAAVATGAFVQAQGTSTAPAWSGYKLPISISNGGIWYASTSGQITELGSPGGFRVLTTGGSGSAPGWNTALNGITIGATTASTGSFTTLAASDVVTLTPANRSSGSAAYLTVTMPADNSLTASTESIGVNFTAATRSFATGAISTQREHVFGAPTYAFTGASTITTAINVDIADPAAGTNATFTNKYALRAASANVTGNLTVGGSITGSIDGAQINSGTVATARQSADSQVRTVGFTTDGAGSVVTAGTKGYLVMPFAGTITGWKAVCSPSGSVAIDIFKSAYSASTLPTSSIVASAAPTITSAVANKSTTLTGWTTSVSADDLLAFAITGTPATATKVTVELTIIPN